MWLGVWWSRPVPLTLAREKAPYRGFPLPQSPQRDRADVLRAHLADQRLDEPRVAHPEIPGSGAGRTKRGGGGIASQFGAGGGGVALRVGAGQRGGGTRRGPTIAIKRQRGGDIPRAHLGHPDRE